MRSRPIVLTCAAVAGLALLSGDGTAVAFPALEAAMDGLIAQVELSGGFTVDPRDGTQPVSGFVAATGRAGALAEPAVTFFGGRGPSVLRRYLSDHAAELRANPSRLLGAYYNRRGQRVVLSIVDVIDDRTTAIALGAARQQVTIYDLASRREIPTGYSAEDPDRKPRR
ncbi:hypothetical protein [Amycolatopsis sp. NPDC051102]|uniref:hypothetical protein n=1 Tax=Amycolatopsis sp. NPDC051102 TaxID=3155163 RepID=UPI0034386603